MNLLSGESSPSNLILKRIPTENPWLTASRYLFNPTINWLALIDVMWYQRNSKTPYNMHSVNIYPLHLCEDSGIPWLIKHRKPSMRCNSMRCSSKNSKMHTLAGYHRLRHRNLLTSKTSNPNTQFSIVTPEIFKTYFSSILWKTKCDLILSQWTSSSS